MLDLERVRMQPDKLRRGDILRLLQNLKAKDTFAHIPEASRLIRGGLSPRGRIREAKVLAHEWESRTQVTKHHVATHRRMVPSTRGVVGSGCQDQTEEART